MCKANRPLLPERHGFFDYLLLLLLATDFYCEILYFTPVVWCGNWRPCQALPYNGLFSVNGLPSEHLAAVWKHNTNGPNYTPRARHSPSFSNLPSHAAIRGKQKSSPSLRTAGSLVFFIYFYELLLAFFVEHRKHQQTIGIHGMELASEFAITRTGIKNVRVLVNTPSGIIRRAGTYNKKYKFILFFPPRKRDEPHSCSSLKSGFSSCFCTVYS